MKAPATRTAADTWTRGAVSEIRRRLPCSVELPAGAGKTELIAATAHSLATEGKRALVLTHTHAGVEALRRRLRKFGVPPCLVKVRTIDSWCFRVVRAYPDLACIDVPRDPDWADCREYEAGAARAARSGAIRRMLEASYEALIVDEYQDCVEPQHDLILAIASTLPTVIFGDPLQGLISFDKTPLPNWEQEVISRFPPCEVEVRPWRWEGGNTDLGNWLLEIRGALKRGLPIDLRGAPVTWIEREPGGRRITAACLKNREGTVVALGRLPHDCAAVASRLRGQFVMMEELQGNFLLDFARIVDGGGRPTIATETLQFARNCAIGVADAIDRRKRERLAAGKSVRTTKSELGEVYQRVCGLLDDASPGKVREALLAISRLRNFRLYRHEAWRGVLSALEHADRDPELTVHQAVVRVRNGVRIAGRRPERRVVARPLLVKGLEYDHAVLLNADLYKTAPELYVALSRARRSVCVISRAATLTAKTG